MTQEQFTDANQTDQAEIWLTSFKNSQGEYYYFDQISQMINGKTRLQISFLDLSDSLAKLARQNPDEAIKAFTEALQNILQDIHADYVKAVKDQLRVSFMGLDPEPMNRLDIEQRDQLICVVGKVRGIGDVQQVYLKDAYRCTNCNTITTTQPPRKVLKCPKCSEKELDRHLAECVLENQRFHEIALLKWNTEEQQYLEPDNASTVWLDLRSDLVDTDVQFEDELFITGIVRISQTQGTQPIKEVSSSFLYLEVNAITQRVQPESLALEPQDIKKLEAWVDRQGENLMAQLVASYAPRIYGYLELKECLLYQAVGSEVSNADERGSMNFLIIGDTGVAKTELAKYQAKLTGGIYQSGEGLSGPGLTVALEKDERTGRYLKRAGLAVRGNGKLKAFDEIDKTNREYLKQLSTVMESQEYYLQKVNHGKYAARGPWLCTGNPLYGNYDPYKNVAENVNFPSWMLSRFDLIFVVRDQYDRDNADKVLAKIDSRHEPQNGFNSDTLETNDLQKYLKLARRRTKVVFDKDALQSLHTYYHALKNTEEIAGMIITPRQYLGLKRMAIACAKLHLRENVTKDDVDRSIFMMNYTLAKVGIDVITGKPDLGVLYGKPQSQANQTKQFMSCFEKLTGKERLEVSKEVLLTALVEESGFTTDNALHCITKSLRENMIYESRAGFYRRS